MSHSESDKLSNGVKNSLIIFEETAVATDNFRIKKGDDDADERIMNDSTMPPPRKVPQNDLLENEQRRIGAIPNGRATISNSTPVTKKIVPVPSQRKKVGRFGLSDWTRLLAVSNDLAQRKGRPIQSKITWKEIKKHNSVHDGWMVIKGKVYNITPYLPYHPGGEKIMKSSLGRDGTVLYEKYHRWVNEDGLIGKLLLGNLDKDSKYDDSDDSDSDDEQSVSYIIPSGVAPSSTKTDGFTIPQVPSKKS